MDLKHATIKIARAENLIVAPETSRRSLRCAMVCAGAGDGSSGISTDLFWTVGGLNVGMPARQDRPERRA